jgi:hypothetical protein
MQHPPQESYRSLELLCRNQAALASSKETKIALEAMAAEYRKLADWVERQSTADEANGQAGPI